MRRLVVLVAGAETSAAARASTSGVVEGLGSFGVGSWPGALLAPLRGRLALQPAPVRASPRLDPRSDAIVRRLTGWGDPAELRAGVSGTRRDWQHPIYYPDGERPGVPDPLHRGLGHLRGGGHARAHPRRRRARPRGSDGASDGRGPGQRAGSTTSGRSRRKPRGGGRLVISWGGRTRIDGDGLGSDANAAHYGSLAGIIRAEEMRRGRIDHALFMLVRCDSGRKVYPAAGARPRVRRPPRRALAGHALPARPLARRDRRADGCRTGGRRSSAPWPSTGSTSGDTTGGTPWNIWFESGATYTSFGRRDPMVSFARQAPASRARPTARTTSTGRAASTGAATCGWWRPAWPSGAAEARRAGSSPRPGLSAGAARARYDAARVSSAASDDETRNERARPSRSERLPTELEGAVVIVVVAARAARGARRSTTALPSSSFLSFFELLCPACRSFSLLCLLVARAARRSWCRR